jgi:ferredoxin-NADP reductase
VSPYLVGEVVAGDKLEVRGPIGGWFVWRPEQPDPVQLVAGGSGLVPLMAMVRTHLTSHSRAPMRLLVSVREPAALFYRDELAAVEKSGPVEVTYAWTRITPEGWPSPPGRVDAALVARATWPPDRGATHYVCGPTGFVEAVAGLLTDAGHDARRVRTERFGPSGGNR